MISIGPTSHFITLERLAEAQGVAPIIPSLPADRPSSRFLTVHNHHQAPMELHGERILAIGCHRPTTLVSAEARSKCSLSTMICR